jgi:hypothetical protein
LIAANPLSEAVMAKMFPNHPNLIGGYAPIQMECDAPDLIAKCRAS